MAISVVHDGEAIMVTDGKRAIFTMAISVVHDGNNNARWLDETSRSDVKASGNKRGAMATMHDG
jgi:hypothetical protein